MKGKILRQCKKVILENNKTERDIKLSLSDKCHLKKLSKKIKEEGNIDGISFEEFVLLCKYYKIKSIKLTRNSSRKRSKYRIR